MSQARKNVVVLLGSTGVGKTEISLHLADHFGCEIVGGDSRQVYQELPIGTAAPSSEERAIIPHHLVGHKSIHDAYSAGAYADEACAVIQRLHQRCDSVLVSGGSMMYLEALLCGIDNIPEVDPEVRRMVWQRYEEEGLSGILGELQILDPVYSKRVDPANYKRVLHGYEVCLSSGKPFSSFHTGVHVERPWRAIVLGLRRERDELYARIDARVVKMIELGLIAEAEAVYPYRYLNALNTVGYKELFAHFDGKISLPEAIRQIQRNSRHYARKQMTWWQRDTSIEWFSPHNLAEIVEYIEKTIGYKS